MSRGYTNIEVCPPVKWTGDDVEVLIDMLEDPIRRWFAAETLRSILWNTRLLTKERELRLTAILEQAPGSDGTPVSSDAEDLLVYVAEKDRPYRFGASAVCAEGPVQMWVCLGYLFKDEESARVFWEHHQWVQTKTW